MDFENVMMMPAMYQDIGSSYMMSPIPMMPGANPGLYSGIASGGSSAALKPALSNDKFEKINEKEQETKHTLKKTSLLGAGLIIAAAIAGRFFKVKNPAIFGKIGNAVKNGAHSAGSAISKGFGKVKSGTGKIGSSIKNGFGKLAGLFKKKKPAAP